jgi:hypothetical protein
MATKSGIIIGKFNCPFVDVAYPTGRYIKSDNITWQGDSIELLV